jgi:hypothetical protein
MWTCPNCRSRVADSLGVCRSCAASRAGGECPSRTHAGAVGPIPAAPGTCPVVEAQGDPRELVECYRTGDQADAALMARYLEERGIVTLLTPEPLALTSHLMHEVGRVLIRPKDVPRARRLLRRIERRRAQRERQAARSAEYPWDKLAALVVLVLPFCTATGVIIGAQLDEWLDWERSVYGIVGGTFGGIFGLSLIIWVYRLRKRADASARAEDVASGELSGV